MIKRQTRLILALLGSLTFAVTLLCGQYKVRTENGVTWSRTAASPPRPRARRRGWSSKRSIRSGGGDPPEASFVLPSALDVLPDGTVYVVDSKDHKVKVFDAAGKFVRAFGRQGQGPGEMNQPQGILISPDNEVLVEDMLNRRLAVFALDGTFRRHISTATALGITGIQMDGRGRSWPGPWAWARAARSPSRSRPTTRNSTRRSAWLRSRCKFGGGAKINPFSAMNLLYELGRDGLLYLGSAKAYEIRVVSAEGKLLKTIARDYDPVPFSQADKDEMLKSLGSLPGVNVKDMIQLPDAYPPFSFFVLADEGRLLVRTFEKGQAKKEFYWDVFDADGRYIARVPIVHDIQLWRDGKAYFFVEDEEGFRVLRCCRARWER